MDTTHLRIERLSEEDAAFDDDLLHVTTGVANFNTFGTGEGPNFISFLA